MAYKSKARAPKAPYGTLKVTQAEFEAAKNVACGDDATADAAYQVVQYCRGQMFIRDSVEEYLRMNRSSAAA